MSRVPPLKTFYAYLTSSCNCACRHCWIVGRKAAAGSPGRFLPVDLLRHAVEQALPLGLKGIKWTGGEPTLHPEFPALLDLQAGFGLRGRVETNGLLVTAALAAKMRDSGVDGVSVSLDGASAVTHDAIRGVPGCFHQTLEGIRCLVAAGYRPELIFTLQRLNTHELPDFFLLAEQSGAGNVKLNIVQPLLQGAELAEQNETLSIVELLRLAERVRTEWSGRHTIPIDLDLPPAFRPLGRFVSGQEGGVCDILQILGILPRGDYALCGIGEHVAELSLGQVTQESLSGIWQSHPVLVALRQGLPGLLKGVCADCLMNAACRGNCIAANFQQGRDLFAPFWLCTLARQQGLFPESRLR